MLDGDFFDQKGQNMIRIILEETKIFETGEVDFKGKLQNNTPRLFEPIKVENKIYQPISLDLIMILDLNLGIVNYASSGFSFDDVSISNNRIYLNLKSETDQNNCNYNYYHTEKCVIFEFDPTSKKFQEVYNTEKLQQMGAAPCGGIAKIKVEFVEEKNIYFSYNCGQNYVAKYDKNGQFVEVFSYEIVDKCTGKCITNSGYGWLIKKWNKDPKIVNLELAEIRRKNNENNDKNTSEKSQSGENLENKLAEIEQKWQKQKAEIENQYSKVFLESKEKLDCSLEENKYQCQNCQTTEKEEKSEVEKIKKKAKLENQKFTCYDYELEKNLEVEVLSEFQKLFPFEMNFPRFPRINTLNLAKKAKNGELKIEKCGNFVWEWKNLENYDYLQLLYNCKLAIQKSPKIKRNISSKMEFDKLLGKKLTVFNKINNCFMTNTLTTLLINLVLIAVQYWMTSYGLSPIVDMFQISLDKEEDLS